MGEAINKCEVCDMFKMFRKFCDEEIPLESRQSNFSAMDTSVDANIAVDANRSCYKDLTFNYTLALALKGK